MRLLLALLLIVSVAVPANAQPPGRRFVSIAFHDVDDRASELGSDAVTSTRLLQFFDWLKGSGWTPVSLDDLAGANRKRHCA